MVVGGGWAEPTAQRKFTSFSSRVRDIQLCLGIQQSTQSLPSSTPYKSATATLPLCWTRLSVRALSHSSASLSYHAVIPISKHMGPLHHQRLPVGGMLRLSLHLLPLHIYITVGDSPVEDKVRQSLSHPIPTTAHFLRDEDKIPPPTTTIFHHYHIAASIIRATLCYKVATAFLDCGEKILFSSFMQASMALANHCTDEGPKTTLDTTLQLLYVITKHSPPSQVKSI
ncbi:uncharacterized protein LOC118349606 [Juglans regia]|uniref:Uncharacterized protein LOC118349606 n=1 Tax=Juglans regia TaxID=51240 RepID=A0A6P9EQ99_JUGRE|nr:uncharacterized protein LOC118349606 [Juglans regia]